MGIKQWDRFSLPADYIKAVVFKFFFFFISVPIAVIRDWNLRDEVGKGINNGECV